MAKIKIKQIIKNSDEKVVKDLFAIKDNNTFVFKDNGVVMKIVLINDTVFLSRDNDEMYLELLLNKSKQEHGYYKLKQTNTIIELKIITDEIEVSDNIINARYKLYSSDEYIDKFSYRLEWSD